MLEASLVERASGFSSDDYAFFTAEMDGFTVTSTCRKPDKACAGKPDSMRTNERDVKIFGFGIEEGQCGAVDAGEELGSGHGILDDRKFVSLKVMEENGFSMRMEGSTDFYIPVERRLALSTRVQHVLYTMPRFIAEERKPEMHSI